MQKKVVLETSPFSSINVKRFYCHLLNICAYKRQLIPYSFQGWVIDTSNYTALFLCSLAKIQVIGTMWTVFAKVNILAVDTQYS